jgi:hypothetical protein
MNNRTGWVSVFVAGAVLLTGCAAAGASGNAAAPATAKARHSSPSPTMSMASGESMAGMSMPQRKPQEKSTTAVPAGPTRVYASRPSQSSAMICGTETSGSVATLTGLHSPSPKTATWADNLYTCTYQLPAGPLVLSVKESANPAAARGYFKLLRARIGGTHPVTGLAALGLAGYEKQAGQVVFLKDNATLQVDATALSKEVGPQKRSRADLAYSVASNILACWSEK